MEVTSDHGDHWLRVEMVMRVRISKVQGGQCSRCRIEFSFDYGTLLIHILCLLLFMDSCISLLVIPQFSN